MYSLFFIADPTYRPSAKFLSLFKTFSNEIGRKFSTKIHSCKYITIYVNVFIKPIYYGALRVLSILNTFWKL